MAKKAESPSEAALIRVRAICYGFAGTEEKLSHGMPSFHVRGKMFVNFVDDHHGDARLAIWCHCSRERQRELVETSPDRFFVPPYVGVRGWVGARLDQPTTDWVELAIVIEQAWLAIAPPKLARGEGPAPARPPPPPVLPTTDEKDARNARARLTKICLALPDAICEPQGRHATFLLGKKNFAYFLDNHHGDAMIVACVRNDRTENHKLVKANPKRYCSPAYMGKRGWLGIRLESGRVAWKDVEARLKASYASVAPKSRGPHAVPKPAKTAGVAAARAQKLAVKSVGPKKKAKR